MVEHLLLVMKNWKFSGKLKIGLCGYASQFKKFSKEKGKQGSIGKRDCKRRLNEADCETISDEQSTQYKFL